MAAAREDVLKIIFYQFLLLFLLIVSFAKNETHSLYKDSDPMVQFSNDTILEKLTGNKKVWIVEFYSSWCGHCQVFAPKWVHLAWELKNWEKYLNVAAIDCAAERNLDICNTFAIEGYPTIRFFDVGWHKPAADDVDKKKKMGVTYEGEKDIKHIRRGIIDQIEKQTDSSYAKPKFALTTKEDIKELVQKRTPSTYKYLALVFEEPASYTGRILTMDACGCKKLSVKRIAHVNTEMTSKYNVVIFPSLILITLVDGEFKELSANDRTYAGFLKALNEITEIVKEPPKIETTKDNILDELLLEKATNVSSEVYMLDLVSSISFSLRRELPKKQFIEGDALIAMKDWVNLLAVCFPAENYLSSFLTKLDTWLKAKDGTKLKTSEYLAYLETNQDNDSHLPSKIEWRACQGSKPRYRGFPCSLWTLFHTITVNCAKKQNAISALQVMKKIRGFIDHFFGCRYCRDHFVEMAKNIDEEVANHDQAILWLWERHNKVNARIKGAISSDPLYPKIQFPADSMCEECRKPTDPENTIKTNPGFGIAETNWNRKVILEFLKEHYGPDNIRIHERNNKVDDDTDAVRRRFNYVFYAKSASPGSFDFVGFSSLDMNMCIVLYVSVIVTVIGLYVYFIRRRTKKLWKHYV